MKQTIICIMLVGAQANAEVMYTSQTRHVTYEIEVGDPYFTDVYEDSVSAPDVGPFDENLYLNVKWPDEFWTDVEGRTSVSQSSSLSHTLVTATGMSHVHAFVEEDQTQAFAAAFSESSFYVEFDLTNAFSVNLSGDTSWARSTVDPPQEVSLSITLYEGGVAIFSHVREYTYPGGVGQDDGDAFVFADSLAAGSYAIEINAYAEAYSQGPWRQYAEGTATYDVTMTVSVHGDMNCDGWANTGDIPLFVEALLDPAAFDAAHPDCMSTQADMDGLGRPDGGDVQAFVDLIVPG